MKTHEETAFNVTAFFETSSSNPYSIVSSNFDGQGVSWGPHQINLGQGTMQPVLKKAHESFSGTLEQVFQDVEGSNNVMRLSFLALLGTKTDQDAVDYVAENWHTITMRKGKKRYSLNHQWRTFFEKLGAKKDIQELIREQTVWIDRDAEKLAQWIAKGSKATVRMYCLAYDIVTQNGGIGRGHKAALTAARPFLRVYRGQLARKGRTIDWAWMNIVAGTRALKTRITGQTKFAADVASRKFLIIDGEGRFRGSYVDLDEKFGITDDPY